MDYNIIISLKTRTQNNILYYYTQCKEIRVWREKNIKNSRRETSGGGGGAGTAERDFEGVVIWRGRKTLGNIEQSISRKGAPSGERVARGGGSPVGVAAGREGIGRNRKRIFVCVRARPRYFIHSFVRLGYRV